MYKGIVRSGVMLGLALTFALAGWMATSKAAPQAAAQQPAYSYAEYNAYQAAAKETDPQQRIKLLDAFVAKFPKSTLLPYVYQVYYQAYGQIKPPQYDKVMEYADKLIASNDKAVDNGMKLQALYAREVAFNYSFSPAAADANQQAQTANDDAAMGLKLLAGLAKPANMTDAQFAQQKTGPQALFSYTQGYASLILKDYPAAEKGFRDALTADPANSGNAITYFRLGVAYLEQGAQAQAAAPAAAPAGAQSPATPPAAAPAAPPATAPGTPQADPPADPPGQQTPGAAQQPPAGTTAAPGANAATPQAAAPAQLAPLPGPSAGESDFIHGFWALARSIALKGANAQEVQTYLQNQMLAYQKTACQDLLTNEMNQLLQMAQTTQTIDPPANYTLPSGVQLGDYLQSSNLFNIMQDLQAGGDRAQFVWLAVCGNEFPMVPVKVISLTATADGVDMQVYAGPTPQDIEGATTANMDVVVTNQPDAQRLKKDNIIRFTGTLASYDPPPNFLLHWSNGQVNPADIPPATPAPRRRPAGRGRR